MINCQSLSNFSVAVPGNRSNAFATNYNQIWDVSSQPKLFWNILKLVWLRWSIVTFFQWQFFGTGRLHLYLLLPFATNDNLDIEANLQYDFWIAGWLANIQQTKCRYKLSPKQFTHGYTRITGAVGHFSLRQPQGNMGWGTNHFDWVRVILHSFPSITIGWWGSTFVAQSYIGMEKRIAAR